MLLIKPTWEELIEQGFRGVELLAAPKESPRRLAQGIEDFLIVDNVTKIELLSEKNPKNLDINLDFINTNKIDNNNNLRLTPIHRSAKYDIDDSMNLSKQLLGWNNLIDINKEVNLEIIKKDNGIIGNKYKMKNVKCFTISSEDNNINDAVLNYKVESRNENKNNIKFGIETFNISLGNNYDDVIIGKDEEEVKSNDDYNFNINRLDICKKRSIIATIVKVDEMKSDSEDGEFDPFSGVRKHKNKKKYKKYFDSYSQKKMTNDIFNFNSTKNKDNRYVNEIINSEINKDSNNNYNVNENNIIIESDNNNIDNLDSNREIRNNYIVTSQINNNKQFLVSNSQAENNRLVQSVNIISILNKKSKNKKTEYLRDFHTDKDPFE